MIVYQPFGWYDYHRRGEIPKRLKGTVSKTVSGVMLQPGFESLFLRQKKRNAPTMDSPGFFIKIPVGFCKAFLAGNPRKIDTNYRIGGR